MVSEARARGAEQTACPSPARMSGRGKAAKKWGGATVVSVLKKLATMASRSGMFSRSTKFSTPAVAKEPRATLRNLSEDRDDKVRANLSSLAGGGPETRIGGASRGNRKLTSATRQRPFNLRTEERGKAKKENFVQRVRKMHLVEEMMRTPLAQGMPFTTVVPEYPVKPPTKELTKPIDLVLHSNVRAADRTKFDLQVAERIRLMEEEKMAMERQQKMDEEIEIKQLRKELVPRARPMPDFTKPFVPEKSVNSYTIPRAPRFHSRLTRNTAKESASKE